MTLDDAVFILGLPRAERDSKYTDEEINAAIDLRERHRIAGKPTAHVDRNKIVEERIIKEIRERREKGIAKYGVGMERTDLELRDWLQHAKEEALDFAIYLEKCIEQIDYARSHKIRSDADVASQQ